VIRVEKYIPIPTSDSCRVCGRQPAYAVWDDDECSTVLALCEEHLTQLGVAIVECGLRDVRIARTKTLRFEPIGDEFTDE